MNVEARRAELEQMSRQQLLSVCKATAPAVESYDKLAAPAMVSAVLRAELAEVWDWRRHPRDDFEEEEAAWQREEMRRDDWRDD